MHSYCNCVAITKEIAIFLSTFTNLRVIDCRYDELIKIFAKREILAIQEMLIVSRVIRIIAVVNSEMRTCWHLAMSQRTKIKLA